MKRCIVLFGLLFQTAIVFAQFNINIAGTNYTQDFNTLTNGTWTDNATLTGWYARTDLTATISIYGANTGTTVAGGLYAFGVAGTNPLSDRGLGYAPSNAFSGAPGTGKDYLGWRLKNNTGSSLTSITITWTGEQWRKENNAASHTVDLYYQTGATVTDLISGTWVSASSSFTSPITGAAAATALDGNAPANRTGNISATINISIPAGNEVMLRWEDLNDTGNDHLLAIDDVTINATAASNSIITGLVTPDFPPFTLGNCSATTTGTVAFTSNGTFTSNTYTAQLSDDIGSFASLVTVGTLVSDLNSGTINITIPAGTVSGTGYLIRVVSSSPVATGSNSSAFSIVQQGLGGCASSHSDYFRSNGTGDWSSISTWQSSPDNSNWISATLAPDYQSNTITIRGGHTITVSTSQTVDQVMINNGGTLLHSGGTLTIQDGTGDDISISSGGMLTLSVNGGPPAFGSGATINVLTGGTLKVTGTGMTGAGSGVNLSNFVYQDSSILDYSAAGPFSASGVTFFPNVTTSIPIFRTTSGPLSVGGAGATTINGIFECNGGTITWTGSGNKIFRNGIKGTGDMNGSGTTGTFSISGPTAILGGSGILTVPATGLDINAGVTVTMISNKWITGKVDLLGPSSHIVLGDYNLTATTTVNITETSSWVKTNGTGKLTINSVSSPYPFFSKIFPVGVSTVNPVIIASPTTANYSVRVTEPASAGLFDPTRAIQRTWYISSSLTSPSAEIRFGYTDPGDGGVNFVNSSLQIGVNPNGTWSIHQGGLSPVAFPFGSNTWTVTGTNINYFVANGPEILFAVGTSGAILPLDYFITARAQKRNNTGVVSWDIYDEAAVRNFEVQRSVNNSAYTSIGTIDPKANQLSYSFTDPQLEKGTNLYRIKVNRISGATRYSNTVAIINGGKGILITSVYPNPVRNEMNIVLSSAARSSLNFQIYDMAGKRCLNMVATVAEGSNLLSLNTAGLPKGVYQLIAGSGDANTIYHFIKN